MKSALFYCYPFLSNCIDRGLLTAFLAQCKSWSTTIAVTCRVSEVSCEFLAHISCTYQYNIHQAGQLENDARYLLTLSDAPWSRLAFVYHFHTGNTLNRKKDSILCTVADGHRESPKSMFLGTNRNINKWSLNCIKWFCGCLWSKVLL